MAASVRVSLTGAHGEPNSNNLNKAMRAAKNADLEGLKAALAKCAGEGIGVTTTAKPENGGLTVLHYAACSTKSMGEGKMEVLLHCAQLAAAEGRIDVQCATGKKRTAMHSVIDKFGATEDKHEDAWHAGEILTRNGARVDLLDADGRTACDLFPAEFVQTAALYHEAFEKFRAEYVPPPPQPAVPDVSLEPDERSPVLDQLADMIKNGKPRVELDQVLEDNRSVNDLINGRTSNGYTLLSFSVIYNSEDVLHWCTDQGADVDAVDKHFRTALHYALLVKDFDATDFVRLLCSKGADPHRPYQGKTPMEMATNVTQRYWLRQAIREYNPELFAFKDHEYRKDDLHRAIGLSYLTVGQTLARALVQKAIVNFRRNHKKYKHKPLVIMLPGPPGHGKTWSARNIAKVLSADDDSYCEIACGAINDKADLKGGTPFGGGVEPVFGTLTSYLYRRQGKFSVVLLDEMEKGLFDGGRLKMNTGGHPVGSAIIQALLEPFGEGWLTVDPQVKSKFMKKSDAGKIDCSQTVFLLTSNFAQKEIVEWCSKPGNAALLDSPKDLEMVKELLVKKIIDPIVAAKLTQCDAESGPALRRRINQIIPFVPFRPVELQAGTDALLRRQCAEWAKPAEQGSRLGGLCVGFTTRCRDHVIAQYDPMAGYSPLDYEFTEVILPAMDEAFMETQGFKGDAIERTRGGKPKVWIDYHDTRSAYQIVLKPPSEKDLDDPSEDVLEESYDLPQPQSDGAGSAADGAGADTDGDGLGDGAAAAAAPAPAAPKKVAPPSIML